MLCMMLIRALRDILLTTGKNAFRLAAELVCRWFRKKTKQLYTSHNNEWIYYGIASLGILHHEMLRN